MSRTVNKFINRFDGGITDDIRNTSDLSRCAHVAHFDIYSDSNRLKPMPGYVADQDTASGGSNDLKNYNIKAFLYSNNKMRAVGTKSNGTGSKIFEKDSPTTASWTASSSGEGTYDLSSFTFLDTPTDSSGSRLYFVTSNGGNTYLSYYTTSTTDGAATLQSSAITRPIVSETALDENTYITTGASDIAKIGTSSVTDPACDTTSFLTDIQAGDAQMGFIGLTSSTATLNKDPQAMFGVWDLTANPNETIYQYMIGTGYPFALGRDGSSWLIALAQGLATESLSAGLGIDQTEISNGRPSLDILLTSGAQTERLLRINASVITNAAFRPVRGTYSGAMLFYAKLPTDASGTTFKQGIWAVGRRNSTSPIALSLLLDMDDLGSLQGYYTFGNHHFFAHSGDGSVSRLDSPTGTYDVTATYESLVFGSENPLKKIFKGLSVLTENLPSGASVVAKYRTDTDDAWTTIATSSTTGTQRHNFTQTSSGPIGSFQEIQFRIEVTGNAAIKNITLSYEETDDLSFSL